MSAPTATRMSAGGATARLVRRAGLLSPLGPLTLVAEGDQIIALSWGICDVAPTGVLAVAAEALGSYFETGKLPLTLDLHPGDTTFQRAYTDAVCAIPDGETRTYGDLAKTLGVSAQAVGQACGANRIPILIPCHRVLGTGGLGGYSGAGGVETKVWLLRHEGAAGLLI